jgi:hypothetical protein
MNRRRRLMPVGSNVLFFPVQRRIKRRRNRPYGPTIGDFFDQLPPTMPHSEKVKALLEHLYQLAPEHRPPHGAA